ncbi:MAG: ATP phosphoribosyltransferase regulatory subunit [Pararhizobium sp.]
MPLLALPNFAETLQSALAACGTETITVPMIQPAEPFLDTAGEDLRRRIFMTESETGASLCLRPEFTIPVCRAHIATAAGTPRRYSYLGPVFRQRRDGPSEFHQAGLEDLGEADHGTADARAIADAVAVLSGLLPEAPLSVTVGDQAVFEAVVAALGLPAGWQKRLIHAFGNPLALKGMLDRLSRPYPETGLDGAVASLLATGREAELAHYIAQTMIDTGYSTKAGRTPLEIARRLKEKADLARTRLDPKASAVLEEFLALEVPLGEAPAALAGFADAAGLVLGEAVAAFGARVAALEKRALDIARMRYRAAFGRPLDYYTGLVFEVSTRGGPVLAGGGRYDRLLTLLGAKGPIPAVGFSLWLDRIEAAGRPA